MKKFIFTLALVLVFGLFILIKGIFGCGISDQEAIAIVKNFCKKTGISYEMDPLVGQTRQAWRSLSIKMKEMQISDGGKSDISFLISCKTKEVESYVNFGLRQQIMKKYNISPITTEPRNWPPFLSEEKARQIIFSLANKIGLPADVELSGLYLDKDEAEWRGYWIRKHNGYSYEDDSVKISVKAVDGEFYAYGRAFRGEPCPTNVKISKNVAIEEGWLQIERLFSNVNWGKYKNEYAVKSAELKIVQPNVLLGQMVPHFSSKSRLAWKITYELKKTNKETVVAVDFKNRITIKIDATTKKFLGGDYTK